MITAILVLSILNMLFCFLIGYVFYRVVKANFVLQKENYQYERFFELLADTLLQDTAFLKSELVRAIGANSVPQYKALNEGIQKLEGDVVAIVQAVSELGITVEKKE